MSGSHGGNGSRRNWCQKVTFKVRHVPRVVLSVGHRVLARVKPENALAMGLQLFFDTHPATWDDKPPRDAGIEPRPASEFITASTRSRPEGKRVPPRRRTRYVGGRAGEPWTQRPHIGRSVNIRPPAASITWSPIATFPAPYPADRRRLPASSPRSPTRQPPLAPHESAAISGAAIAEAPVPTLTRRRRRFRRDAPARGRPCHRKTY
jgi:hypothetical protein